MNHNAGLPLCAPRVTPVLDPCFRPAVLANRRFGKQVAACRGAIPLRIALEQGNTGVSHYQTELLPGDHPEAAGNFTYLERIIKFLLWSRGGWRIYVDGPADLVRRLAEHFQQSSTGLFDSNLVGERMFDHPLEVLHTRELPPERQNARPLGRHLEGCRIGFDLGGSDRKAAGVIDGKVVFSEETVWDPYFQKDPQYHLDGIIASLKKAAAHLPRVDAIGGSAAGVYVENKVKVASLFRGVPADVFATRVRNLFDEVKKVFPDVPFEVVNDGEVTALAGSMALNCSRILGVSLGTSTAGGYVNGEGNITSWLNELAFVPIDYNPAAARDEWSGDYGCGVQYFSQQCVGRLLEPAGIEVEPKLPLPEQLKQVQKLMDQGDYRAAKIYQTIGTYLGYGVAHFADFYALEHVLILGRVTSGPGGTIIIDSAREVLRKEFPDLSERLHFHVPEEKEKRHGQAVAAASLPSLD